MCEIFIMILYARYYPHPTLYSTGVAMGKSHNSIAAALTEQDAAIYPLHFFFYHFFPAVSGRRASRKQEQTPAQPLQLFR